MYSQGLSFGCVQRYLLARKLWPLNWKSLLVAVGVTGRCSASLSHIDSEVSCAFQLRLYWCREFVAVLLYISVPYSLPQLPDFDYLDPTP